VVLQVDVTLKNNQNFPDVMNRACFNMFYVLNFEIDPTIMRINSIKKTKEIDNRINKDENSHEYLLTPSELEKGLIIKNLQDNYAKYFKNWKELDKSEAYLHGLSSPV